MIYYVSWLDFNSKRPNFITLYTYRNSYMIIQVKAHVECQFQASSIRIYGITFNPYTNKYMMVYQYADKGDLWQYLLKNFPTLVLEQKISILISIALDLLTIHHEEYLHKNLHSGNILLFSNANGIKSCISDLGLSRKMSDTNTNEHKEYMRSYLMCIAV